MADDDRANDDRANDDRADDDRADESAADESAADESAADESAADESAADEEEAGAAERAEGSASVESLPGAEQDAAEKDLTGSERVQDSSPYPDVSPREQRLAGWGCVAFLVLAAGLFWFMLELGRKQMVELDQTNMLDAGGYLSPAEREAAIQAREARRDEAAEPAWRDDYEQAFDEALMSEIPIVLFFESASVEASRRMHSSTFANGNVRAMLQEFVAIRVDTTDPEGPGAALAARFEVEAPAIVYLDPEGQPLRPPSRGVVDADAFEIFLREALGNLEDGRSTAHDRRSGDAPEQTIDEAASENAAE